jgi:hypothetical protein
MPFDNVTNFAKGEVAFGYNASATSISLTTAGVARMPTAPFSVTWWNSTDYPDPADDPLREVCYVPTAPTGLVFDGVIRGQQGTSASLKNLSGKTYQWVAGPTAKMMQDIIAALSLTELSFSADGDGQVIPDGAEFRFTVLYPVLLNGWFFVGDGAGSVTLDVLAGTPVSGLVTLVSIVGSAPPVISGVQVASSTSLPGWSRALAAGDIVAIRMSGDSVDITQFSFKLRAAKTF